MNKQETKLKKTVEWTLDDRYNGVIAFLITAVVFLLALSYASLLPNGKDTIFIGDLYAAYMPFGKLFTDKIREGSYFYYTFHYGMGDNTALLFAFYSMSIFNVVYFFVEDVLLATTIILVLKVAFSAWAFWLYCSKNLDCKGKISIAFSVTYALCSYQFAVMNVCILEDALYFLPIILVLVKYALEKQRYWPLALGYAALFITNFYCGYVVGIVSFCYLGYRIAVQYKTYEKGNVVKIIFRYGISVVIAFMLSAFLILPAAYKALEMSSITNTDFVYQNISLFDIFSSFMLGHGYSLYKPFPYLYCGLIALCSLPFYLFNKELPKAERISVAGVLAFLILAIKWEPLYMALHMFNEPDGYTVRFGYVISFILVSAAVRQVSYWKTVRLRSAFLCGVILCLLYPVPKLLSYFDVNGMYLPISVGSIIANVIFAVLWLLVFWVYKKEKFKRQEVVLLVTALVLAESLFATYSWFSGEDYVTASQEAYHYYSQEIEEGMETIKNMDDGAYRVTIGNILCSNSGALYGANVKNYLGSSFNIAARDMLHRMGTFSSDFIVSSFGRTEVMDMLMAEKYFLDVPSIGNGNETVIIQNPYALEYAYMVSDKILGASFTEDNALRNQNEWLDAMTGTENHVYDFFMGEVQLENKHTELTTQNGEYQIFALGDRVEETSICFKIPYVEGTKAYAYFSMDESRAAANSPLLLSLTRNYTTRNIAPALTAPHIVEMEPEGEYYTIYILFMPDTIDYAFINNLYFAYYNESALQDAYDRLSENQMEFTKFEDGYVKGTVTATEEMPVLFMNIPYANGWTAFVDGMEQEIVPLVDDAFIGLELEPGTHEVELQFVAPYSQEGIAISVAGIIMLALFVFLESRKCHSKKDGEVITE